MRVVVRLLDEGELLSLRLVQTTLDAIRFLELLEREDEELRVVLVREGRERNRRELARLEPVHGGRVDRDGFLRRNVRLKGVGVSTLAAYRSEKKTYAVLEVRVLPLLLSLEVKTSKAAQVLLRDRLVDRGTSTDTLTVVVSDRRPPVGLRLDETEDDVLDGRRHSGHLPRDVGLEATPRLCKVLQNGLGLVLLDALRHHVEDVVHDGGTELEIEVRVDPLLRDRLGDSLRITTFELTREEVAEPALEERDDTAKEEEPDTPARRPETDTGTLSDGTGVEARVDLRGKRQHPSPTAERLKIKVLTTCFKSLHMRI